MKFTLLLSRKIRVLHACNGCFTALTETGAPLSRSQSRCTRCTCHPAKKWWYHVTPSLPRVRRTAASWLFFVPHCSLQSSLPLPATTGSASLSTRMNSPRTVAKRLVSNMTLPHFRLDSLYSLGSAIYGQRLANLIVQATLWQACPLLALALTNAMKSLSSLPPKAS